MLIHQFIEKEIVNYGLLKVTDKGREYLEKPYSIMLTKDHNYEDGDSEGDVGFGGGSATDAVLFSMLKDLRKSIAKKLNLPPFVIFSDPSLQDMAIQYPITMDELTMVSGVGQGKAQKYGKEFIELISKHVQENEIERPQDFVVKSVVNKSTNKVFIIKNIDKKMPLDEICNATGLEMSDLLDEIEAIVNSGTRINIDYYLDSILDEDVVEDIYLYFKEDAETDSLEEAMEELNDTGYSEEEVRLVRIKFISEMGN
jgi:ATP-dependent DNA helicase RecQ